MGGGPGKIVRRTPYGFGIPKSDMRYFNEHALYGYEAQNWKCLLRTYTRYKHQWYQAFGHMAATRGYTSRTPNERWGIQIQGKYSEELETSRPQDLKAYMDAEIDNRVIHMWTDVNNEIKWGCGYCVQQFAK